jgi:hypothetical protein
MKFQFGMCATDRLSVIALTLLGTGLLAILLLFFVGTVLAVKDEFHIAHVNGLKAMARGEESVRHMNNSTGMRLTAQRNAANAASPEEKAHHEAQAASHGQDAVTHRATAHSHFKEAERQFDMYVFFDVFVRHASC